MTSLLDNISVILVGPQGSSNIGMVARAIKNCGITHLKLVAPENYKIKDAYQMACHARDVVDDTKFYDTLGNALTGETCSVAFTRRLSKDRIPFYSLKEITPKIIERAKKGTLALVFGRETDGLTQDEIYQCSFRAYIPTSKKFGSLNLAQAVLLACHEIFKRVDETKIIPKYRPFATNKEIAPMVSDFNKLLMEIGYENKGDFELRKRIVQAFKDIIGRAGLRPKDVNMFLGIWGQIRKKIGLH